ncbi:MAG: PilZ domain-containing protein [Dyella sp.]
MHDQDAVWQDFSQSMAFEGALHLSVLALDVPPDATALAGYNERNLHVLRALASLDERRVETSEDESPVLQELLRMDSKINVLMEIVNRLLVPLELLPMRQPIRFNALGILLPAANLPSAEHLLVRLHFDACRALPLEMAVQFVRMESEMRAFLGFVKPTEMVHEGLERFVFRHHRRKVAEARLMSA